MGRRNSNSRPSERRRQGQTRALIAQKAAQLMAEQGIRDFGSAKRKAAERLGLGANSRDLPDNREVQDALAAHQQLFLGNSQPANLRLMRETALKAMQLFTAFAPRLVGPVLTGTADLPGAVHLHLFADTVEAVTLELLEQRIPFELDERKMRYAGERKANYPLLRFVAGEVQMELTVFPRTGLREAPLSPVDGRPTRRADIQELRELLAGG